VEVDQQGNERRLHLGRDATIKNLKDYSASNFPKNLVDTIIKYCPGCAHKFASPKAERNSKGKRKAEEIDSENVSVEQPPKRGKIISLPINTPPSFRKQSIHPPTASDIISNFEPAPQHFRELPKPSNEEPLIFDEDYSVLDRQGLEGNTNTPPLICQLNLAQAPVEWHAYGSIGRVGMRDYQADQWWDNDNVDENWAAFLDFEAQSREQLEQPKYIDPHLFT
jgi:hypothetical protein